MTGGPIERKLFSSRKEMTFVQDGAPAHTSKAAQTWCQKNLPNFIAKDGWPANSPDLNPIENIWSIIDETTYLDPALKTMKELKRRLSFAWKNVTLDTLQELTHSIGAKKMPLKIKAGILVTNNWNDRMKNRQTIINNSWTRLSKISWFVSGEQINYLPKPKAEANNWSARHWQIMIFCDNRVQ